MQKQYCTLIVTVKPNQTSPPQKQLKQLHMEAISEINKIQNLIFWAAFTSLSSKTYKNKSMR